MIIFKCDLCESEADYKCDNCGMDLCDDCNNQLLGIRFMVDLIIKQIEEESK